MKSKEILAVLAVLLATVCSQTRAEVPPIIHFQGVLSDEANVPLNSVAVSLTFRLFDELEGGTLVWTQTFPDVPVTNGFYEVTLGDASGEQSPMLSEVAFDTPYFIEIELSQLGSPTEILGPRKPLGSVAYSLGSAAAEGIDLVGVNGISIEEAEGSTQVGLTALGVDTQHLAVGAVETEKIQDGAVVTAKIEGDPSDGERHLVSRSGVVSWDVPAEGGGGDTVVADAEGGLEVSREDGSDLVTIGIAESGVAREMISSDSVDEVRLADDAVTSPKLKDASVTSAKIGSNEVVKEIVFLPEGTSEQVVLRDGVVLEGGTNVQLTQPTPNTIRFHATEVGDPGDGTITSIAAGNGLTGTSLGGPEPTLNVGQGTGVLVGLDEVSVDVPSLAGNGLSPNGSDSAIDVTTGDGLRVSNDQVQARIGNGLEFDGNGAIAVAAAGIGTSELENESVNADKIRTGAVRTGEIFDGTILGQDIANDAITRDHLDFELGVGTITGVAGGSGLTGGGTSGDVTVAVGQGTGILVAEDAIAVDVSGISGSGLRPNGSGSAVDVATGDGLGISSDLVQARLGNGLEFDGSGAIAVAAAGIGTNELENGSVNADKIGTGAVRTGEIFDGTILGQDIANDTITLDHLDFELGVGTITGVTAGSGLTGGGTSGDVTVAVGQGTGILVAEDAISVNVPGISGNGLRPNGSGSAVDVATGDGLVVSADQVQARIGNGLEFDGGGAIAVAPAGIGTNELENGSVNADKIGTGAVRTAEIFDGTILGQDIANDTITLDHLDFVPGVGTITGVTAGNGLTGGGTSGNVMVAVSTRGIGTDELQEQVAFGGSGTDGRVQFLDAAGTQVTTLGVHPFTGQGHFWAQASSDGSPRAILQVSSSGFGEIAVLNESQASLVEIATQTGGQDGNLNVYNTSQGGRTDIAGIQGVNGVVYGTEFRTDSPHPADPGSQIAFAALSGPESGIYDRGQAQLVDGEAAIELDEHFALLVSPQSITVTLTPRSRSSRGLAAIDVTGEGFTAVELMDGTGSYSFDYVVWGVRKGHENFDVYRSAEEQAQLNER